MKKLDANALYLNSLNDLRQTIGDESIELWMSIYYPADFLTYEYFSESKKEAFEVIDKTIKEHFNSDENAIEEFFDFVAKLGCYGMEDHTWHFLYDDGGGFILFHNKVKENLFAELDAKQLHTKFEVAMCQELPKKKANHKKNKKLDKEMQTRLESVGITDVTTEEEAKDKALTKLEENDIVRFAFENEALETMVCILESLCE